MLTNPNRLRSLPQWAGHVQRGSSKLRADGMTETVNGGRRARQGMTSQVRVAIRPYAAEDLGLLERLLGDASMMAHLSELLTLVDLDPVRKRSD